MSWGKWHIFGGGVLLGFLFLALMGFSIYGWIGWIMGSFIALMLTLHAP